MAAGERSVKIKFTGDTKGLDRAAKAAEDSVDRFGTNATKSIGKVAAGIPDMFAGVVGSLPPQGQAIAAVLVGGLAVTLAPMLAAAITAAILAAVGGGVLALGIKSAMDNPKVAAAFDGLKSKATKIFDSFGKPFEAPLIRAAETFSKVLDDLQPQIEELGRIMAPVIDKLAPALGEFFKNVMPGIESAVEASVPLFDKLAEHLPKIGEAIAYFFSEISKNGDDAATFFGDLLTAIEGIIKAFGWLIGKLAEWYGAHRRALVDAKNRFVDFKNGAIAAGRNVLDWFRDLPGRTRNALSSIGSAIVSPFRNAFNAIVRYWNSTVGSLSFTVPGWVPGIGGNGWSAPRLSERASGGPVTAGRSYLVGERGPEVITMGSTNGNVTPNRELGGGGDIYEIHVDLGNAVKHVIRVENRNLKRRAQATAGAY